MRFLITFSYNGSKYKGFQKQKNAITIQEKLETVLSQINKNEVDVHSSGRTDALVHALNQKAHFDLDIKIDKEQLKKAMNSLLPDDIYIKKVQIVNDNFHARYDALKKEYVYKINLGEYNPFETNLIYQYNEKLNIEKMVKALKILEGIHNFKAFTKVNNQVKNYTREIYSTNITLENDILSISIIGNGFLRYMVRNIIGVLLEVGKNKLGLEDVVIILNSLDRTKACITAPAQGLYLKDVFYDM